MIQQQIVSEIEAEREIVEANRRLIEIYEAKIKKVIQRVWGSRPRRFSWISRPA